MLDKNSNNKNDLLLEDKVNKLGQLLGYTIDDAQHTKALLDSNYNNYNNYDIDEIPKSKYKIEEIDDSIMYPTNDDLVQQSTNFNDDILQQPNLNDDMPPLEPIPQKNTIDY